MPLPAGTNLLRLFFPGLGAGPCEVDFDFEIFGLVRTMYILAFLQSLKCRASLCGQKGSDMTEILFRCKGSTFEFSVTSIWALPVRGGGGVSNLLCSFLLRPYLYQCGIDMVFCRFWLFLKELLQRNTYLTHIIA